MSAASARPALLDTNVLLALAWPNHQHHAAAHRWFARDAGRGWRTCALTRLAFVRLSSNPSYTPAAVSPGEAALLLDALARHPRHEFWGDLPAPTARMFTRATGHQQVTDAYLVALAAHHRGRIVTFDVPLRAHATVPDLVHLLLP